MFIQSQASGQLKSYYDSLQTSILNHKLNSTAEKIAQLDLKLIIGHSHLFDYNLKEHAIVSSPQFDQLLKLLVELGELDAAVLEARSISDLNAILQKAQGPSGGLLRKEGTERWDLNDNPIKQKYRQTFDDLFKQLGFVEPKPLNEQMEVSHCILFGARVERMEARITQTINYLKNNLKVTDHVFLKGSNRKLMPAEIEHLKSKIELLQEPQKSYWNEVFSTPDQSIEANAFVCLWRCLVPEDIQVMLEDKLVCIKSTRIGFSYNGNQGHRPTTESTVEDCLDFFKSNQPRSIFAVVEQPYIRLVDQSRFSMLTRAKQTNMEELIARINNTVFNFAFVSPSSSPLISVILDEIARSVYRTMEALKFIENIKA